MVPPKQKTLRVVKHPQGLSVVFRAAGDRGIGIPLKQTTQPYRDGPNVEVTEVTKRPIRGLSHQRIPPKRRSQRHRELTVPTCLESAIQAAASTRRHTLTDRILMARADWFRLGGANRSMRKPTDASKRPCWVSEKQTTLSAEP